MLYRDGWRRLQRPGQATPGRQSAFACLYFDNVAEQCLVHREAGYLVEVAQVGQLVDVPLAPRLGTDRRAAAHDALDRPDHDVLSDPRPVGLRDARGAHLHQIAVGDAALGGIVGVRLSLRNDPLTEEASVADSILPAPPTLWSRKPDTVWPQASSE